MQEALVDGKIDVTCGWIKTTGIEVILGGREGGGKKVAATNKKFPRRQIDACFLLIKSLSGR